MNLATDPHQAELQKDNSLQQRTLTPYTLTKKAVRIFCFITLGWIMGVLLPIHTGYTEMLREATVTRALNQVEFLTPNKPAKEASVGEILRGNTSLQTGKKSRAELTFPDKTLARLGATTLFSFDQGTRTFELNDGTLLLQVPKKAGGGAIKTATVTATITGTTVMMEYNARPGSQLKFIVIEGEARFSINARLGESSVVGAGQMIAMKNNAKTIPPPQTVELTRLLKTSKLINEGKLGNQDAIMAAVALQNQQITSGQLVNGGASPTNPQNPAMNMSQVNQSTLSRSDAAAPATVPAPAPAPVVAAPPTPVATPAPAPVSTPAPPAPPPGPHYPYP